MPNINPIILAGSGGGGINYSVNVFTSSGTYTKPANLDYAYVLMVSGGGGARSGRRGSESTNRAGGGSLNGGAVLSKFLNSELNTTESVTVGAGGVGGAAVTTNNTNGIFGTVGGNSNFKHGANFQINGGFAIIGGASTIVTAASSQLTYNINNARNNFILFASTTICHGTTAIGNEVRGNNITSITSPFLIFVNTSCGGQITNTNIQLNAGSLGGIYDDNFVVQDELTGTLPETTPINPTYFMTFGKHLSRIFPWFDPADANYNIGRGGLGGGCGNTAGTIAGVTGANAIGYGAGGGGGGASTNGANSGAGGNGSTGIVIIINVLTS